jgi:hypothetical protein
MRVRIRTSLAALVAGAIAVAVVAAVFAFRPSEDGRPPTLQLRPSADSEVRVSVDGTQVFSGTLAAGEQRAWDAESRVEVWSSNARALDVAMNGVALGSLAEAVHHSDWDTIDWNWPANWSP